MEIQAIQHPAPRVGTGYGLALAILIAALAGGSVLGAKNRAGLSETLALLNSKGVLVNSMKSALLEGAIEMRNIGLQSNAGAMQNVGARVRFQQQRYAETRAKLEAIGLSEAEKQILADIAQLDKNIEAPFREAMNQAFVFNNEAAAKTLVNIIDPLHKQELVEITRLVDLQYASAQETLFAASLLDKNRSTLFLILGAIALGIVGKLFLRGRKSGKS